jgi:hypothetical protein
VLVAGAGAVTFALGDRGQESAAQSAGAVALGAGLAALFAAGVWAAARAACDVDSDCLETEYCQKLFTTAGAYGHCLAR